MTNNILEELLAQAKPLSEDIPVPLDGEIYHKLQLVEDEIYNLEVEIDRIQSNKEKSQHFNSGVGSLTQELDLKKEEKEKLLKKLRKSAVTLHFQALEPEQYSNLRLEHKPRIGENETYNEETFPDALTAASLKAITINGKKIAAEPGMWDQIKVKLPSPGISYKIGYAVVNLNWRDIDIPFA